MKSFTQYEPTTARLFSFLIAMGVMSLVLGGVLPSQAAKTPNMVTPMITPDQAKAIAVNSVKQTEQGIQVHNRLHDAEFSAAGMQFTTKRGGLKWQWQLESINLPHAQEAMKKEAHASVVPQLSTDNNRVVQYRRDGIVEQYVAHANSLEQQFVLPAPLELGTNDLVIRGLVTSPGRFEEVTTPEQGTKWQWRAGIGVVSLGDVTVLDATGAELPATMHVTATSTHIVVSAATLAKATYPVTIDPEIGVNDFRISDAGEIDGGLIGNIADGVGVAYNSIQNEYLVVWSAEDDAVTVDNEFEIFGQRINAATGAEVGNNDFRISDSGGDGNTRFGPFDPAVTYNSTNNEYLVVWEGTDDTPPLVVDENEIFGQRIHGDLTVGDEVGTNDFRISDMGDDSETDPDIRDDFDALAPAVAYNSTNNEYLVVWEGDDDTAPLVAGENEIFGQRLNAATGGEVGANDFRISDMGDDTETDPTIREEFDAQDPDIAYNPANNEYLLVWQGDDDTAPLVAGEKEIFGQRLFGDRTAGDEVGTNDFRLSDMGDDTETDPDIRDDFDALEPAVAYNSTNNEYLVVWKGDDVVNNDQQVHGQLLNADPASFGEIGENDFLLSDIVELGSSPTPRVAFNSTDNECFIVWAANDETAPSVIEVEVFGQLFAHATEMSSEDLLKMLIADVKTLVKDRELRFIDGLILKIHLKIALWKVKYDRSPCRVLRKFVKKVDRLVDHYKLASEDGQRLIDKANQVREQEGCIL